MKSLAIRGAVLVVVVLALAVPAFASQPGEASGYSGPPVWIPTPEGLVGVADFYGTFEGVLSHVVSDGRASEATFTGCVDGRCGELAMILVTQMGLFPQAPGHEGNWVILHGTGDLETLRGQGTFVIVADSSGLKLVYEGQYHFDPE